MEPREILPGLFHWTTAHPKIRIEVSTYWLADPKVLLDPLLPPGESSPASSVNRYVLSAFSPRTTLSSWMPGGKFAQRTTSPVRTSN